MNKNQKGFALIGLLLVVLVLAAIAGTGWFVYTNQAKPEADKPSESESQSAESEQVQTKTMELVQSTAVSVTYGNGWERLTEFGYDRDGLVKTSNGQSYIIELAGIHTSYDYMDKAAGGAFPVGTLYKQIEANGKVAYIGTYRDRSGVSAFLSTCPITANGGCSIKTQSGSYVIASLSRHEPTDNDYKARKPLDLGNATDGAILDEFAQIMTTIKY